MNITSMALIVALGLTSACAEIPEGVSSFPDSSNSPGSAASAGGNILLGVVLGSLVLVFLLQSTDLGGAFVLNP